MFGNKKTSASSDDDVQLTTRSMKSDLEGKAENSLVKDKINPNEPIKNSSNPLSIPSKKEMPPKINQEAKIKSSLPTDLPVSNKVSKNLPADDSFTEKPGINKEKTHADDFFPNENEKEKFPKNPTFPSKSPEEKLSPTTKKTPSNPTPKKDYDEFFKNKISTHPEKETENNSSNIILVIILIVVLIIAIASGTYYYFFVINKPSTLIEPPIVSNPTPSFPIDPEPVQTPKETLPSALVKANELTVTAEQDLKTILLSSENPENLTSGFYSIKNEEGSINIKNLSALLNIQIAENINIGSQNTWIYYNSLTTPEISLIINIESENTSEIKASLMAEEENLPLMLSGLYSTPIDDYLTGEAVIFKDSNENLNFRYYNFATTLPDPKSLDWGMINNDKILVFATSKEMASIISNQLMENSLNEIIKETTIEKDVIPEDISVNELIVD